MIETLVKTIPSGIGEPFAIGVILSLCLLFPPISIQKNRFFWAVCLFFIMLLLWRIVICIIASRYSFIVIYPATLFTAFFCYYTRKIVLSLFPLCPNKIIRLCPLISAIIFIGTCIAMTVHINPHYNHYQQSYEIIKKELKNSDPVILVTYSNDFRRIEYYTGVSPLHIEYINQENVLSYINSFREANSTLIIDIQENVKDVPLSSVYSSDSKLELLYSNYTTRKEHRKHNIYRYFPNAAFATIFDENNIEINRTKKNILINGDLKETISEDISIKRLPEYMQQYNCVIQSDFVLPENGFFLTSKFVNNEDLVYFSTQRTAPENNKNSIILKSHDDIISFIFYQQFPAGKYRFSAIVKGKPGSKVALLYQLCIADNWSIRNAVTYTIPDERSYALTGDIYAELNESDFFLVGARLLTGEAQFNNFKLTNIDKHPITPSP